MSPLPAPTSLTRRDLSRFDRRVGLGVAARVLRENLSLWEFVRVMLRYGLGLPRDPLRVVSTEGWPPEQEVLVRHQLRAAVRLDDALADLVDEGRHLALLEEVVSETGAEFIRVVLPLPSVADWGRAPPGERVAFLKGAVGRFFNAAGEVVLAEPHHLGFDITACRFAHLCTELGRPYLAPMLCTADSVYFSRPESPVRLERAGTIAAGAVCCDFRFTFAEPPEPPHAVTSSEASP